MPLSRSVHFIKWRMLYGFIFSKSESIDSIAVSNFLALNQANIRPADLIPEPKVKPVIAFEFRVVEIVVAGCNDVTPPPAFDPALWIDFPACVIEHGVNGHQH